MKQLGPKVIVAAVLLLAIWLRFYQLGQLPGSLYWEEAALGYDAWSIAQTGADHHGHPWPVAAFESFGDWKPSGYFYALAPFVKVWGLRNWVVRAPAAVSGIMLVVAIGALIYLTNQLFWVKAKHPVNPIWAMFILAVSPWAVMFSRAAWEVNLAVCLLTWGVVAFFKFILTWERDTRSQTNFRLAWLRPILWLIGSAVLLVLSMYTYQAARLIAPLIGLGLATLFAWRQKRHWQLKRYLMLGLPALIAALIMIWPMFVDLKSGAGSQRFRETSLFYNLDIIKESNARRAAENYSLISRLLYHRYLLFGREIIANYFSYFNANFLFLSGDANPRHSTQYFGQLYHLEAALLVLGLYYLIKRHSQLDVFLLWWLAIGILPAAISTANPHALRTLFILPVVIYCLAAGVSQLLHRLKPSTLNIALSALLVGLYLTELLAFWHHYSTVYALDSALSWQAGYEQLITELNQAAQISPTLPVYLTREQGRPAMYYWFYSQTDPRLVQAQEPLAAHDQGEFLEFGQVKFIDQASQLTAPALVASSPQFQTQLDSRWLITPVAEVRVGQDAPVWLIYTIK